MTETEPTPAAAKSFSLPPAKRPRHLALTLVLAAAVTALLVFANRHYFFQAELYEGDDFAANSLSILRAEHFSQLYGQYSRWGFRHPGPAMFYWLGLGEKVFYQWLHLVPTPFNAQGLAALILFACLLAASLSIASRWVRSGFFLPLALLAATLHFTAVDTRDCLTSCWPPFEMVMPFVLLLVVAASVMAGQGADLPLLALAGCLLIHLHVAQPLFVLPMFALAYAGLAWACWRRRTMPPATSARPWRQYRWAHWAALGLAVAFVLPIVADLFRGTRSNLGLILVHMHTHSGEPRHPWQDSVYYFLRFGVYKPSLGEYKFTAHGDQPAILHLLGANFRVTELSQFFGTHLRMAGLWLIALLLPFVAGLLRIRRAWADRRTAAVPHLATTTDAAGRWRFLGCLIVVWVLSIWLTLFWGHIQDGEMFYFNAWFDYGIYFALGLIAVMALSDGLELLVRNARHPVLWKTVAALVCLLGAGARVALSPGRYTQHVMPERIPEAHTVFNALAEDPAPHRPKLLLFPHDAWISATTVATLLQRRGVPLYTTPEWDYMFGDEYGMENMTAASLLSPNGTPTVDFWRFVPAAEAPALMAQRPLVEGYALMIGGQDFDPNPGASIDFVGSRINADLYVLSGFSTPRPRDDSVWSQGKEGLIYFHPHAVPDGSTVEVTFDFEPNGILGPKFVQRLGLRFNSTDLGTQRMIVGSPGNEPPQVSIPAALWNKHPDALLELDFLDTASPFEKGLNGDTRQLGFISRKITFRVVPVAAGQ